MREMNEPLWERTLRRIQDIWSFTEGGTQGNRFSKALPDGELPRLRRKIDACLQEKGGEVSARAHAAELGRIYSTLDENGRRRFLELLAAEYDVDNDQVEKAIGQRRLAGSPEERQQANLVLRELLEPPRTTLLRRFNELEEGVKFLVDLRVELMQWAEDDEGLRALDRDVYRLLSSWFDIGFLVLQQVTWNSPAALLEKLIEYEAVHAIRSWHDLKHRLSDDRLCYAFFHPRMPNEPLIFVEVALVNGISDSIDSLLDFSSAAVDPSTADTAIFYSISNCQKGLAGVSFGNFLIKRVVADLAAKMPNVRNFCTLSPVPGFLKWLRRQHDAGELASSTEAAACLILGEDSDAAFIRKIVTREAMPADKALSRDVQSLLMQLCARYLLTTKKSGRALDPVANFHLSNGARLERINWAADLSDKGLCQSAGLMVNYLYELRRIEENHESYVTEGEIPLSSTIRRLIK